MRLLYDGRQAEPAAWDLSLGSRGEASSEPAALLSELSRAVVQGLTALAWKLGRKLTKDIACVDVLLPCRVTGPEAACHTSSGNSLLRLLNGKTIILVPKARANTVSSWLSHPPQRPKNTAASKQTSSYTSGCETRKKTKEGTMSKYDCQEVSLQMIKDYFSDKVCSRREPSEEQQAGSAPPRLPPTCNDVTWRLEQ